MKEAVGDDRHEIPMLGQLNSEADKRSAELSSMCAQIYLDKDERLTKEAIRCRQSF
jgi:hypothetical protein